VFRMFGIVGCENLAEGIDLSSQFTEARLEQLTDVEMLAIGRATMSRPKMLLLDEPSMGLSPLMARTIMGTVAELRDQGTTILLVEQNASAALTLADRAYVLETGHVALSGTGRELLDDESVRRIYLGEH